MQGTLSIITVKPSPRGLFYVSMEKRAQVPGLEVLKLHHHLVECSVQRSHSTDSLGTPQARPAHCEAGKPHREEEVEVSPPVSFLAFREGNNSQEMDPVRFHRQVPTAPPPRGPALRPLFLLGLEQQHLSI